HSASYNIDLARSRPSSLRNTRRHIPFDIGADILKPWFIIGCSLTAITFFGTLFLERWLRHRGRLRENSNRSQKILAVCAILASALGGLALILLAVFDTRRYQSRHRLFLAIFVNGVFFSAVFTVAEYGFMVKHSPEHDRAYVRRSSMAKSVVATILIGAAIGMAVCLATGKTDAG
ncbi:hypothetical protein FRC03_008209, partial [Tulasnella sp. 419]